MRQSHNSLIAILCRRWGYLVLNGILYGTLVSQAWKQYANSGQTLSSLSPPRFQKKHRVQTDPGHQVSLHVLSRRNHTVMDSSGTGSTRRLQSQSPWVQILASTFPALYDFRKITSPVCGYQYTQLLSGEKNVTHSVALKIEILSYSSF